MSYFDFSFCCRVASLCNVGPAGNAESRCVLRLFQCFFTADRGMFQQYALADATRAIKVGMTPFSNCTVYCSITNNHSRFYFCPPHWQFPSTFSYDEAATIPLCFHTAALGLYGTYDIAANGMQWRGIGLDIPIGDGAGKYKDEPILITGGASSVGQFGACSIIFLLDRLSL